MSLRDELAGEVRGSGGRCTVGEWLASQDKPDEWTDLFTDPQVQASALFRLMRNYGWQHTDQPVQRHKRLECACGRPPR